jgi:heme-degrading monooxygenase HmoA
VVGADRLLNRAQLLGLDGAPHAALLDTSPMVTELAILDVLPGREGEFERAFGQAKELIASARGFRSLELQRCLEQPGRYLLIVGWERLADHTEGFRGSSAYEEWRRLLHRFYDPFPTVEHYTLVDRSSAGGSSPG